MRRSAIMRVVAAYLRRQEASIDDGSIAEWLIRAVKEGQRLQYYVRTLSTGVPCPEPHFSEVKRLMREARAARRRAFNSPPGADLRIAVLEWHYNLALALGLVQLPYSQQAMKGRRRVVERGKDRRKEEPRNAAARMKRMGESRGEARAYLENQLGIPQRTASGIVKEIYGPAARRRK